MTVDIDLEVHDHVLAELHNRIRERGCLHEIAETWPVPTGRDIFVLDERLVASMILPRGRVALYEASDGVAYMHNDDGEVRARTFAEDPAHARRLMDALRAAVPAGVNPDPEVVPVTFWTYSPNGPRSLRRDLDASEWDAITSNYTTRTATAVAELVDDDFRPGVGGQLILWHGDPGTGKTTALRALARQWRDWCEIHYVVDPDVFFGVHADYMMSVLMGEDVFGGPDDADVPKWRLLVLEDCGEMLQPDARREVGQALSRFLNACDGLIGRGLRIMVLVTTNEPVSKLHDAVSRPGRCAARVEFERFGVPEARAWLAAHGATENVRLAGAVTLADLYGIVEGHASGQLARPVGFAA